jgi:hypothetical protein
MSGSLMLTYQVLFSRVTFDVQQLKHVVDGSSLCMCSEYFMCLVDVGVSYHLYNPRLRMVLNRDIDKNVNAIIGTSVAK